MKDAFSRLRTVAGEIGKIGSGLPVTNHLLVRKPAQQAKGVNDVPVVVRNTDSHEKSSTYR
jgi:hypothetical protein